MSARAKRAEPRPTVCTDAYGTRREMTREGEGWSGTITVDGATMAVWLPADAVTLPGGEDDDAPPF